MSKTFWLTFAVIISIISAQDLSATEESQVSKHYDKFVHEVRTLLPIASDQLQSEEVTAGYREFISESLGATSTRSIGNDDLKLIYRASITASFYTHSKVHIDAASTYLKELQRRNIATERNYLDMYDIYISARRFDEATELYSNHKSSDMEPLPKIRYAKGLTPGHPSELEVLEGGQSLNLRPVSLAGRQIIVVSHPLCHFSVNAAADIARDPVLASIFKGHSIWIAPPYGELGIRSFDSWNTAHPDLKIAITFEGRDWPFVDSWATPTFYFVKDGRLSTKIVGWPPIGGKQHLLNVLRQQGFIQDK